MCPSFVYQFIHAIKRIGSTGDSGLILCNLVRNMKIKRDLIKQIANRFSSAGKMASAYHLSRLLRSYTNKCGEIYDAIQQLSTKRKGALIIIQRDDLVEPYITKGIHLDSMITSSLLDSIFHVGSPLHDGAVLIRNDTIDSAANILPLTKKTYKGKKNGYSASCSDWFVGTNGCIDFRGLGGNRKTIICL